MMVIIRKMSYGWGYLLCTNFKKKSHKKFKCNRKTNKRQHKENLRAFRIKKQKPGKKNMKLLLSKNPKHVVSPMAAKDIRK